MKEWLKEFWDEFTTKFAGKLGELLGGFIGGLLGTLLYWLGQQGVYSYLRDVRERAEANGITIAEGQPFWTQLFTHPWVTPVMFFMGAVIFGTVGVLVAKKLK